MSKVKICLSRILERVLQMKFGIGLILKLIPNTADHCAMKSHKKQTTEMFTHRASVKSNVFSFSARWEHNLQHLLQDICLSLCFGNPLP